MHVLTFKRLHLSPRVGALLVVLALISAEIGLRISGVRGGVRVVRSLDYGWVALPNEDVLVDQVRVHINRDGFRDVDWAPPGPPASSVQAGGRKGLRIALLGDSVSYGTGLPAEQRCTELLARELTGFFSPEEVIVMNFAFPGYTFEQMKSVYFGVAQAWKPDVVVVALNSASQRPPVPAGNPSWVRRLLINTALYHFWLDHGPARRESFLGDEGLAARLKAVGAEAVRSPFSEEMAPLWHRLGAGLLEIRDQQAEFGGQLVVLALPNFKSTRRPEDQDLGAYLSTKLERSSIDMVDPLPAFRNTGYTPRIRDLFPKWPVGLLFQQGNHEHMKVAGQRLLATALAAKLTSQP